MDFFEQQDIRHRKTRWLVAYFVVAVICIVIAIYFVTAFAIVAGSGFVQSNVGGDYPHGNNNMSARLQQHMYFEPQLFAIVTVITVSLIGLGTMMKVWELKRGGESVAMLLGGRRVDPSTTNPGERQLMNVVEEMAIASGLPVPPVYVLEQERGINAFAAGFESGDAVIGVTRGCLEYLSRDELQGVMAHEFSHILNGDMRLNLRLMGTLNGILIIAIIGWTLMRYSIYFQGGGNKKDGGGAAIAVIVAGIGLLIVGSVGLFFAKLIKAAVSREREYLADAAAVQFTRNPSGIGGALQKIGGSVYRSKLDTPKAEEASHMFFSSAFLSLGGSMLSTHPPLDDRIRRILPDFKGEYPKKLQKLRTYEPDDQDLSDTGRALRNEIRMTRDHPQDAFDALNTMGPLAVMLDPVTVLSRVGTIDPSRVALAHELMQSVPKKLSYAVREPFGATLVIYCLLLDSDLEIRKKQLDYLSTALDQRHFEQVLKMIPEVVAVEDELRLPMVELAMPSIRSISDEQYKPFRENVEQLVKVDGKIDLFEYTVRRLLMTHLDGHFGLVKKSQVRYRSMQAVAGPIVTTLSVLAYSGQSKLGEVQHAFEAGLKECKVQGALAERGNCSLKSLDEALDHLADAAPTLKREILAGCTACILADKKVTQKEGDLLRAVAASLGCPIPPFRVSG